VLVGKEYWEGMMTWLKTTVAENGCIGQEDLDLFVIVDTAEEAANYIYRNIEEE
jgi:predicted Rossmann-fold nucleotide-binding protein